MLGKRKIRYAAVSDGDILKDPEEDVEDIDFVQIRRRIFTPQCCWTSTLTCCLILLYFAPSISLTFYQRWLLQQLPFPLSIVLVHMAVKWSLSALCRAAISLAQGRPRLSLNWRDYIMHVAPIGAFSGIDIGCSNWGLELITISLYTMTKSTTIIFILGFAILLKLEKKSWSLCFIVTMISLGLALFTYKATQFNAAGFSLLLVASAASGVRWSCTQLLLQRSHMGMRNPIDMIYFMQPWMIASIIPFALWIEGPTLITHCQLLRAKDSSILEYLIIKVLIGAFIAFFMEATEVMVVTYTSSLTLSVAGIFKEVFILVMAVLINGDEISGINAIGLTVCLFGIAGHVVHKLRSPLGTGHNGGNISPVYRHHHGGSGNNNNEQHQALTMSELRDAERDNESSDNAEESDSQVLFNILKSRDR